MEPRHGLRTDIRLVSLIGKRQGLQIQMLLKREGFGQQRTEIKTKHKLKNLDPSKVEVVQTFGIFARKLQAGEPVSKWESIGEILLENESDVDTALKERRKKLLAAAKYQYPSFMILETGEELQYGFHKVSEVDSVSENDEITVVDVKGKEPEISIPAILRADDGIKPTPKPPKRF